MKTTYAGTPILIRAATDIAGANTLTGNRMNFKVSAVKRLKENLGNHVKSVPASIKKAMRVSAALSPKESRG